MAEVGIPPSTTACVARSVTSVQPVGAAHRHPLELLRRGRRGEREQQDAARRGAMRDMPPLHREGAGRFPRQRARTAKLRRVRSPAVTSMR